MEINSLRSNAAQYSQPVSQANRASSIGTQSGPKQIAKQNLASTNLPQNNNVVNFFSQKGNFVNKTV
jgi:hypothetical protein